MSGVLILPTPESTISTWWSTAAIRTITAIATASYALTVIFNSSSDAIVLVR